MGAPDHVTKALLEELRALTNEWLLRSLRIKNDPAPKKEHLAAYVQGYEDAMRTVSFDLTRMLRKLGLQR